MMFPARLHNMLVEAAGVCQRANSPVRYKEALDDLDYTIGKVMDAVPHMFTTRALKELDNKRKDKSDEQAV